MQTCNYLFALLVLLFCSACSSSPTEHLAESNSKVLTLDNNLYVLDGQWEFYWEQLLTPNSFKDTQNLKPMMVKVPSVWTEYEDENGDRIPPYGYATYRLVVDIPKSQHSNYGVYIPKIWSAAKVWINGELLYEVGKVTTSAEGFENKIIETFVPIYNPLDKLEIIVQVANYNLFVSSGLAKNFSFGPYEKIYTALKLQNALDLVWIGCIFIMAIYHYILFLLRQKKDYSTLYFGLVCTAVMLSWLFFGDHFFYEFIKNDLSVSYTVQSKVYFIAQFCLVPLGLHYLNCLYPKEIHKKILKIATWIFGFYCTFILLAPPVIFTAIIPYFFAMLGLFAAYIFIVIIVAATRKRREWQAQLVGISTMILAGANDALATAGIEITGELATLHYALGVFLIVQFYILTKSFSDAFSAVEDLSMNLEKKVAERTREVTAQKAEIEHKNRELNKALKNITSSVRYASRLQTAILGGVKVIEQNMSDSFVLYLPRDMVSGDFFWYEDCFVEEQNGCSDVIKVLIAADCTGHGVPGALMTILGNNFLDDIIKTNKVLMPDQILYELDKRIIKTFSDDDSRRNEGMDISVVVINRLKKQLYFSGAKSPLYYVRNNEINVIKGSKFPIGSFQFKKEKIFKNHVLPIQEDDSFYIFSDGYSDQFGGENQKTKYLSKNFREYLLSIKDLPMAAQKDTLLNNFNNWKGKQPQTDDILVIGFKV